VSQRTSIEAAAPAIPATEAEGLRPSGSHRTAWWREDNLQLHFGTTPDGLSTPAIGISLFNGNQGLTDFHHAPTSYTVSFSATLAQESMQNVAKLDSDMKTLAPQAKSAIELTSGDPAIAPASNPAADSKVNASPVAVSKVHVQKPFTCYPRKGGGYIVDGTPRTPLKIKSGEIVINKRVQETWPDKSLGYNRREEINSLLCNQRIIPTIQSNLSEAQNLAAEEFFIVNKLTTGQLKLVSTMFRKANWSEEQLKAIEDFFVIEELTPSHLTAAIKMFRELKNIEHMDWSPVKLVQHAVATLYRQDDTIPLMPTALDKYIEIRKRGDESKAAFREGSSHTAEWIVSLLKAAFQTLPADKFTDDVALHWINGDWMLERADTEVISSLVDGVEVQEKVLRIVACTSERPWETPTNNNVRIRVRAIRNWFASQGWGAPSKIKLLKENDTIVAEREQAHRVLTTQEKQRILDNAYKYKTKRKVAGFYAAHFVQRLFGGCRKKDTERFDPAGFKEDVGKIGLTRAQTKNRKSRNTTCMPNYNLMASGLRARGLFDKENLNPPKNVIQNILALSGFEYKEKKYQKRYKKEMIPGNGLPFNALRRSSMSAHFQVTEDPAATAAWAGTSGSQWDTWYERSYTKPEGKEHWQMLPTSQKEGLTAEDLELLLPEGHKLDNVVKKPLRDLIERTNKAAALEETRITTPT
jgi:hypothetical protein